MFALAHDLTVPLRAIRVCIELLLARIEDKLDADSVELSKRNLAGRRPNEKAD